MAGRLSRLEVAELVTEENDDELEIFFEGSDDEVELPSDEEGSNNIDEDEIVVEEHTGFTDSWDEMSDRVETESIGNVEEQGDEINENELEPQSDDETSSESDSEEDMDDDNGQQIQRKKKKKKRM